MKIVDSNPIEGVNKPLVSNARAKNVAINGRVEHLNVLIAVIMIDNVRSIVTVPVLINRKSKYSAANIQSNKGT